MRRLKNKLWRFYDDIIYELKWFYVGHKFGIRVISISLILITVVGILSYVLINHFDYGETVKAFFENTIEKLHTDFGKHFDFIDGSLRLGQKILLGLTALYIIGAIINVFKGDWEIFSLWFSLIFYTLVMFLMTAAKDPYEKHLTAAIILMITALVIQVVTSVCLRTDAAVLRVVITLGVAFVAAFVGYWFGLAVKAPYESASILVFTVFFIAQMDAIFDEFSTSGTPFRDTIEDVVSGMTGDEVDLSDWTDM